MNAMKKMLLIPTSALLLAAAAGSAQADTQPMDRIDDILTYAADYGFSHIEEINVDDRGRVEVEGWIDDEWYADVDFSIDNGESLQEERKRLITGAWA
ncbi:PepSY domain-containing protein [Vreelandella lionensis]|uniref:PepSY domain-containing protein n=1 Tax=Vreelandella lionensis TaxID=1144478 RepID=UPI001FB49E72|nr:PepSY domain-containing protein [Halomonas lionensis]